MKYVWVHLGEEPNHLKHSITSVQIVDPSAEIILVNDESVHRIASEQTLEIMNEDTGERDPLWNNDRLWGTSLYRCFLLRDIAKTFAEDEPYIHFDSDVILYEPFEKIKHLFHSDRINMTFHNDHEAVFGFSYFPNVELNDELCNHLYSAVTERAYRDSLTQGFPNEMQIIGGIGNTTGFIHKLDIIPNENSEYVFDPSSYGQYFGGTKEDPPGWYGVHQDIGARIHQGYLKPTMVNGKPFANGVPIINLHIHSKNTGAFI